MYIAGIETSCDETAVAVLKDAQPVANLVASQTFHHQFGGVVPEYASREHMRLICTLFDQALREAEITPQALDAIAVTYGPGLMGALLVGLHFAKGLALTTGKPLLAVNHIEGHIMANFLDVPELDYPFLCLLVSGGHTQIVQVEDFGRYRVLGRSLDDAAGEAFDKGARILGLPYPGGPIIDQLAHNGNPDFFHFPRAQVKGAFDFSFSGLKTALLYYVRQNNPAYIKEHLADICAAYQEAIVAVLLANTIEAVRQVHARRLVLAGGVAANARLRLRFQQVAQELGVQLYFPAQKFCTDNAAMIARTGYEMFKRQITSPLNITAVPNLRLPEIKNE